MGAHQVPGMNPVNIYSRNKGADGEDSEAKIQEDVIALLRVREWVVRPIGASALVYGWPDLYAAHPTYGQRWIEIKRPVGYSFTPAQRTFFPLLHSARVGIWILTAGTELEIAKLFQPANWYTYLSAYPATGVPNLTLRPTHTRKLRKS